MIIQYYLRILAARKKLILGVTLAAFIGSVLLALIWPNAYESTVRVHVQPAPPSSEQAAGFYYSQGYYRQILAEFNIEDFSEIVEGRAFAANVAAILDERYGVRMTPRDIAESLRATQSHRILELTYTNSDPLIAQALADAAQTIFETKAATYSASVSQGLVSVQIVDPASEPEAASLARLGLDVIVRTLVAFLLITGLAFLLEILSGQFRSREDIEEALRAPVLATIPSIPEFDKPASGSSETAVE